MDDRQLRDTFEEYVDGVQPPPESVTERAKNQISRQRAKVRLIKRISVAAACAACACLITLGVVFSPIIGIGGNKANGSAGWDGSSDEMNNAGAHDPSSPGASGDSDNNPGGGYGEGDSGQSDGGYGQGGSAGGESSGGFGAGCTGMRYYPQSQLTRSALNLSGELPEGLDFLKDATARGFTASELIGYFNGEELHYAQTEITATIGGAECEATVYAEFTDENYSCDIFKDYFNGKSDFYKGNHIIITYAEDNGGDVMVFMHTADTKYFISVKSADAQAYTAYLDWILGN